MKKYSDSDILKKVRRGTEIMVILTDLKSLRTLKESEKEVLRKEYDDIKKELREYSENMKKEAVGC